MPSAAPSISVIIPHYNRPDQLKEAVRSVTAQTLPPAEILIVDDCSRPEVKREIESLSSVATIVHNGQNLGLAGSRNAGLAHAKSEWVSFLDDDDLYVPHKLERQVAYLREHPDCQLVGGGLRLVTPDGEDGYRGRTETRRLTLKDGLTGTAAMIQTILAPRKLLLKMDGFDRRFRYMEDFELGIRLLAAGLNMHYLAEPMFVYHLGGRDQLSRHWIKMLKGHSAAVRKHRDLYRQEFGRTGELQMYGRLCQHYGLGRGGLRGRSVWAAGRVMELVSGNPMK